MTLIDRRTFVQLSAAALWRGRSPAAIADLAPAQISSENGALHVAGADYSWDYTPATDRFQLFDSKKRLITAGILQPAIVIAPSGNPAARQCASGKPAQPKITGNRISFEYQLVNGSGRLSVTWRFDDHGVWIEPIVYESSVAQDIVSLHYFADIKASVPTPALQTSFLVVPGVSESSAISPILSREVHLNETIWLGRGSSQSGLLQQWGLPVHYFGGFSLAGFNEHARDLYVERQSDAFVCGLADLPNADLFLDLHDGSGSVWMDYRSDIWKHLRTPGQLTLGATLLWAFGAGYYDAIGNYYANLAAAGLVRKKQNSARKIATALTPQFCTWGAQVSRDKTGDHLDQAFLENIYQELKDCGLKARMFSIDDKWEGVYGKLEHSADRLPHFEEFLDRVRADGNRIGLWAALMRCEKPSDLGLTEDQMLKNVDGTPFSAGGGKYFILDFTQPEVARVLADLARKFIRRYKPDLLKFDFGYELPALAHAAPHDKRWSGERMMWKGLDVVIGAMRQENPDLVVMYYQLSPLFLEYFDLHSPDDLFMTSGEYDLEANRRFFFSGLLGQLGVPTYGSSGYDWQSAPNIWFDSSVIGTLGSLNDFNGDERGEKVSPELVAKYNGLARALRSSDTFKVIPLDNSLDAATRGAHSRSWARLEDDKAVLLAIRPKESWSMKLPTAPDSRDAQLSQLVDSNIPVVVASGTSDDISHTGTLVVVPYGDGTVSIVREAGRRASVSMHYFKGAVIQHHAAIQNGRLTISVRQRNANNDPLEWIDVQFTS